MTNDAKLGLLAGIVAVLVIAVLHHRQPVTAGVPGALPPPKAIPSRQLPSVSVVPKPSDPPAPAAQPDTDPINPNADPLLRRAID